MTHAKSLRVVGQKLELAKISLFQLEHDGLSYAVQSDSMSRTTEWMLRYLTSEGDFPSNRRQAAERLVEPVIFSSTDLARLDHWEAKRRREFPDGAANKVVSSVAHFGRSSRQKFSPKISYFLDA